MWPCYAYRAISDGAFTAQITDLIVHPSWRVDCTPYYTLLACSALPKIPCQALHSSYFMDIMTS